MTGEASHLKHVEDIVVHVCQFHLSAEAAHHGTHRGLEDTESRTGHIVQFRAIDLQVNALFECGLDVGFKLCSVQRVDALAGLYDGLTTLINNLCHLSINFKLYTITSSSLSVGFPLPGAGSSPRS